jgi:hypothetical protein
VARYGGWTLRINSIGLFIIFFLLILFKELGKKEWVIHMKPKFNFCHLLGSYERCMYLMSKYVFFKVLLRRGTWFNLTYGININS